MKTTDKKRPVLHCIEPEPDKKQCDNEDVIEFIAFLMSEHSKEEKIDAICNHWMRFCVSKQDVKLVFCCVDVIDSILTFPQYIKDMTPFLCFAIMKSQEIRQCVMEKLVFEGLLYTNGGVFTISDALMLLTACSVDLVSDKEMAILLDYCLSLTQEYLLEQLVLLGKLSRSLPFVERKHTLRLAPLMNRIADLYLSGSLEIEEKHMSTFISMMISISKMINCSVREMVILDVNLWKHFLFAINHDYEIPDVCRCPYVVDQDDIPYLLKERMKNHSSSKQ